MQSPSVKQEHPQESQSSSSGEDFDFEDSNQKFFNLADVKPLDFKAKWLGNTNQVISKFQTKLSELHREKMNIKSEFDRFAENQNRFKISSLRKINIVLDKKQLYDEYMQRTRKTIEKLHPSLIINICSYAEQNVFLGLARLRRVSKIFSIIYKHDMVVQFFSEKDFGKQGVGLEMQEKWCDRFIGFRETFLYYKQIKYTVLIPQNSIKEDIEEAVKFINEVYKHTFALKSTAFGYFHLLNRFMRQHRVVLALQALTFTDMAVTKKASIVAFSNYLAFNPSARQKEEITKTKYLKMIQMVEDQDYRDSLFINSKISTFLQEQYNYQYAVFIDTLKTAVSMPSDYVIQTYDLVIYHIHNEMKSSFFEGVTVTEDPIEIDDVTLRFQLSSLTCFLNYRIGNRIQSQSLTQQYFPTFIKEARFGHCYVYRGEFYYVILIKQPLEQNKDD